MARTLTNSTVAVVKIMHSDNQHKRYWNIKETYPTCMIPMANDYEFPFSLDVNKDHPSPE